MYLTLSMWFPAHERLARVSHCLTGVEQRLKMLTRSEAPTWESWLRGPELDRANQHLWSPEATAFALFYSIAVMSIVLALLAEPPVRMLVQLLAIGAVVVVLMPATSGLRSRFKRWKAWLTTPFAPPHRRHR